MQGIFRFVTGEQLENIPLLPGLQDVNLPDVFPIVTGCTRKLPSTV